ncbi:MAG: PmoA family protein, partial [Opitutaceae bacterium]
MASAPFDRAGQVIRFTPPPSLPQPTTATDGDGRRWPVQTDPDGQACLVVPWQAAGQTLVLTLEAAPVASRGAAIESSTVGGGLAFTNEGKPVLSYHHDPSALPRPGIPPEYHRAGYIHPIYSPSGALISDDYPPDHIHHHGIWSPWTKTEFQGRTPDFWNMGKKTGTVERVALNRTWSGWVHGGFEARHRMVDLSAPNPVTALNETWDVVIYRVAGAAKPVHLFELTIRQTCATNDPLILPEYHYGGTAFRGRAEWLGATASQFLTAEGETDRVKAQGQRTRWIAQSGAVGAGAVAGLAMLGHPDNVRAPQPVRIHPREPYFCFTPSQLGRWTIEPGHTNLARYPYLGFDGAPDPALIEAYWQGFAPPAP